MRPLFATLLLLAACATAPDRTPEQRVAGCWIDRNPSGAVTTMRWLGHPQRTGALRGAKVNYGVSGPAVREEYVLEQRIGAWTLCQVEADGERCWQVAQGESGSLEGGRAFIDAFSDRLRISVVDASGEREIYQGRRDGCD
jgi:hypothetical protein